MLSFASKRMRRMACTQPPLLLLQRLLTTSSSVLVKNSKAPLRPVATDSSKRAGRRSDAHTGVGAVRAMKTMMTTAPSRVGQRAFYHTPQAAPLPVVDQLLPYMSANNYVAKTVRAPQSDKTKEDRSESNEEMLSPEEQEVEILKRDFFKKFKGFKFDPPKANEDFTSYKKVWHLWCATVPGRVKKHEGPITLEDLQKYRRTLETICGHFMSNMDIKVFPESQLLEATLFLLKGSLVAKDDPEENMLQRYNSLCQNHAAWLKDNECVLLFEDEAARKHFEPDRTERVDSSLRELVKGFLTLDGRNTNHVLMIGGESGSGKTHLGIHAAKIGLEEVQDKRKVLTIVFRVDANLNRDKRFAKYVDQKSKDIADDDKRKRNAEVANYLCKKMCNVCGLNERTKRLLTEDLPDKSAAGPYFQHTVLLLDETVACSAVMQAVSTSVQEGFVQLLHKKRMARFFGTVHVVCSSTGSEDSILNRGSIPSRYYSIQMRPSEDLFQLLTTDRYQMFGGHSFLAKIVQNRRCAVFAAKGFGSMNFPVESDGQDAKKKKNELLRTDLSPLFKSVMAGLVAWNAAYTYSVYNGLRGTTPSYRASVVQSVVRAFLEARSKSSNAWHLFRTGLAHDAIRLGIVGVHIDSFLTPRLRSQARNATTHTSAPKANAVDKVTYTFSSAQLALASMLYGSSVVSLHHPESHEALSLTLFSLFIAAYEASWGLFGFLQLVDPGWKGVVAKVAKCAKGDTEGHVAPKSIPDEATLLAPLCRLPCEDAADAEALFEYINEARRKHPVLRILLLNPKSSFADGLIVWGDTLILMQAKPNAAFYGKKVWRMVLQELLKCGFSIDTKEALSKEQRCFVKDTKGKYAGERKFTEQLVERCNFKHVLSVLSVPEACHPFVRTVGLSVDATGLHEAKVYPLLLFPGAPLSATFQKTATMKDGEAVWESVLARG